MVIRFDFLKIFNAIFETNFWEKTQFGRHVRGKFLEVETETEIGIENFMANETGYGLGLDIFLTNGTNLGLGLKIF